jgi:outer membrane lipoprotein-sorting protein
MILRKKRSIFLPFLFLALGALPAFAETKKSDEAALMLTQITSTYRKADLVEVSVEKSIGSQWGAKEKVSKGKIYYSHGKIRWEISSPEKVWTIYNGKTLWNIEFASPDFPDKNKVTITKVEKKSREQYFLIDLLENKNPSEKFKIARKESNGPLVTLSLELKKPAADFNNIEIIVEKDKKFIQEISYKDDLNTTKIKLGQPEVLENSGLFEYKPNPEKDQVTNL